MKVCIGITTKNRRSILSMAIDSALTQDYSSIEVFVFDDGSTDDTSELSKKYPSVRWERTETSIGLLEARNRMMRTCDADIFVSLDDDAWFLKNDEISIAVDYFRNNSKLGAVAFDILEPHSSRFKEIQRDSPIQTNFFKGAGHALRLSAVIEAGYYMPFPLRYGHEEKDLGILILDLGYIILFLPGVHVWHQYTSLSRNKSEQDRAFVINDLIFKFRRVPFLYLLPVLGKSIFQTLRGKVRRDVDNMDAIATFFQLLPKQIKYVKRIKMKTYRSYRELSKMYLSYLTINTKWEKNNDESKTY